MAYGGLEARAIEAKLVNKPPPPSYYNSPITSSRIVLPLGQSYVLASYFSIWKKILRALLENALFYVTFFVIFVVLFIYLVVVEKIIAL